MQFCHHSHIPTLTNRLPSLSVCQQFPFSFTLPPACLVVPHLSSQVQCHLESPSLPALIAALVVGSVRRFHCRASYIPILLYSRSRNAPSHSCFPYTYFEISLIRVRARCPCRAYATGLSLVHCFLLASSPPLPHYTLNLIIVRYCSHVYKRAVWASNDVSLFSPSNLCASVLSSRPLKQAPPRRAHRSPPLSTFDLPNRQPRSASRFLSPFRLAFAQLRYHLSPLHTLYRLRLPAASVIRRRGPFSNEDACLRFPSLFSSRDLSPLRTHTDSPPYCSRR